MFHNPPIDGMLVSPTGTGANRLAWNAYGAPRVPRLYSPSSRPSLSVAITFEPYSSKLRTRDPFSNVPLVDVTFSSPLKNEPLIAAPVPAISKRNGISFLLTTTVASHRPARLWPAAPAGIDRTAATAGRTAAIAVNSFVLITSPGTQKSPEGWCAFR